MRRSSLALVAWWGLAFASVASASGPADELLRLVPADSGMTLVVEDLRDHTREIAGSTLFEGLRRLPVVRSWLASDRFVKVERASRDVQAALGVSLATLRDELLGDAVVLAFQGAPSGRPDQARGLLLARPRDRALADRLLKNLNDAQLRSGEQIGLQPRTRGRQAYFARLFKAPNRPAEFYLQFDDGLFVWSNSESMVQGVIDRKAEGHPGLGDDPDFQKVRRSLPDRPIASLFVKPHLLQAMMGQAPRGPDDRAAALLSRYVGAVGQLGITLNWRDGLAVHTHETVNPEKLAPWLKRWLTGPPSPVVLPGQVPSSAVAVLALNMDPTALREALLELIPEDDRPSLENLRLALQGILLGQDPVTEVLPRLSPGAVLYLEIEPDRAIRPHFPVVGVAGWSDRPGAEDLANPIDNALRTALAVFALNRERQAANLGVESRAIGDSKITAITNGLRAFLAYRVDGNRLVLSNSAEAVARFGAGRPPAELLGLRARDFPTAESFAIVDLARLVKEIKALRGPMARSLADRSGRPVDAANHDLGELIALAELFKAATVTSVASKGGSEVHRTFSLIAR